MKVNAFEVASRYVYPSLRRRLVEHLRAKGLKQTEIAELLHVTQSAISRYLSQNRGSLIDVSQFKDVDEALKDLSEEIIAFRPSEYDVHMKLVGIALKMLGKGYVCSFHAHVDPEVKVEECHVCLDLFG